jgi:imidazolonepropionase-like amidohydrolase
MRESLSVLFFLSILSPLAYSADLPGWADKIGALETGHYADLIGVSGDPSSDVHVLESVKFVMKGGTVMRNDLAVK